jgi:hypothetical protein
MSLPTSILACPRFARTTTATSSSGKTARNARPPEPAPKLDQTRAIANRGQQPAHGCTHRTKPRSARPKEQTQRFRLKGTVSPGRRMGSRELDHVIRCGEKSAVGPAAGKIDRWRDDALSVGRVRSNEVVPLAISWIARAEGRSLPVREMRANRSFSSGRPNAPPSRCWATADGRVAQSRLL